MFVQTMADQEAVAATLKVLMDSDDSHNVQQEKVSQIFSFFNNNINF